MSHKYLLDYNIYINKFQSTEEKMESMGEKHNKFIEGNRKHLTIELDESYEIFNCWVSRKSLFALLRIILIVINRMFHIYGGRMSLLTRHFIQLRNNDGVIWASRWWQWYKMRKLRAKTLRFFIISRAFSVTSSSQLYWNVFYRWNITLIGSNNKHISKY